MQTNASSEELERQRESLQSKESELLRESHKLQEDLVSLQQQQKELAARQSIYNQQQLDFISRKNALTAQQFDFADKLTSYNAQVKTFNDNLEKFESDRSAFRAEQTQFEERVRVFETERSQFNEKQDESKKIAFEEQQKLLNEKADLQARITQLQEREIELNQREIELNNATRDFQYRQYSSYENGENRYFNQSPYAHYAQAQNGYADMRDLHNRAQNEGIRLQTAGNMHSAPPTQNNPYQATQRIDNQQSGCVNVGLTLYRCSFIIFCIVAFESMVAYFLKDFLKVSLIYPIVGFTGGFITFIVCSILYATGFRARTRRKKHASYVVTASVLFVICVIIVTMIAVYFKAQIAQPDQLLAYVILPVVYLLNIMIFAGFYYLLSTKSFSKNS